MKWLNPPPHYQDGETLTVVTGDHTDFWRETHYGFIRDDGHLYYQEVSGDFSAEVCFRGEYQALYDQAGLMLRLDEKNWIKAGIEYTDGLQHLSAVVTRDYSDWSVLPLPDAPQAIWLRLTRRGSAVQVQYSLEGTQWHMLRLAYLPLGPAWVGPMCCSPQRAGFVARFSGFKIGEPITEELHS